MPPPYTFDVLIQHPSADVYAYAYDHGAHTLRLDGVWRVTDDTFAERGIVVNAVTPRGEALRAWIVADLPIAPQTRVAARAVGAIEFRRGELLERVIVAVPIADSRYAHVQAFNDLPAVHRAMLQRVLEESARWLDANSAEEIVHLARQRARLAQVEEHEHGRARPAWEADERSPLAQLARETTLHTQAEAALFTVPYRFQQHLRLCLRADERILFWVHRPRFTFSRIAGLGGKTVREGLLVITDQQCLWLVDPVTPTVPVEGGYGYIARTVAIERVAQATLTHSSHSVLEIVSTNARGARHTFRIEFPHAALTELEQAVRLLNAFAPRSNDQRLRRVFIPGAPRLYLDDPMDQDRAGTAAMIAELQSVLAKQLNGETICAQTFVPAWADGDLRLLTVTNRRVLMIAQRTPENLTTLAVQDILASEICYSVFASWLKLWTANPQPFQIAFPLTSFAGFNVCWRTTRELVTSAH